jgi:hypothetical protein
MVHPMVRVFGTFGLGMVFVAISPALRETLVDYAKATESALVNNSPFSYVAVGVAVLAGMMFVLHRASQPRV